MRSLQLSIVALALSGCIVPLTGAPCATDDNCPSGQHCAADRTCQSGSPDKGDGGASVDSGVACQSDPGCDGADKPACDPAGSGKLGTCKEAAPGCFKVDSLTSCPTGEACSSGKCRCTSGCTLGDTACFDTATLKVCQVADGGLCGNWTNSPCPTGLICGAVPGKASQCQCPPPNPTTTLYVNPNDSVVVDLPTGANVASCKLASLTDAFKRANGTTRVVLVGADKPSPAWTPLTVYKTGDLVAPLVPNGYSYQAATDGTSGKTEPAWKTDGTVTTDGAAGFSWAAGAQQRHISFDAEAFPLAVPANVTLTSSCGGAGACDGRGYVITVPARATGAAAITLGAGSMVEGVMILSSGTPATALASCTAGIVVVRDSYFVGDLSGGKPRVPRGLLVGASGSDHCSATLTHLVAAFFTDGGVAVEGAGADATIAGGLFYGSLVGLAVYDGTVSLEDDGVLRVTAMLDGVGILVGKAGAGTAAVSVMNPNLQFNSVGLGLVAGSATVSGGDISYNGLTPGPVTAGGIVASGGTLLVSNQTRLSNNLVGLVVDGASAAVSSATFQANNTQGVVVNSTPADGSAQLQSVTISGGTQGVAIKGGTVIIDSADIGGASADGVTIEGKQDLASATFTRLKVHDNKAAGISASGGAKGANLHLSSSEIYANYAGGFSVTSALELAGFQGNKLHGNGNAQIIFSAAPPASAWDIKSSCLDASIENEVYCYPTGAVGVRLDMKTAPSKTVSAKAIGWANAAPAQDVDFAGPAGSIDVSGQCSAVPCP